MAFTEPASNARARLDLARCLVLFSDIEADKFVDEKDFYNSDILFGFVFSVRGDDD